MVAAVPELHSWYSGCLAVARDGTFAGGVDHFDDNHPDDENPRRRELRWEERDRCYARIITPEGSRWERVGDLNFPIPEHGLLNLPSEVVMEVQKDDAEQWNPPVHTVQSCASLLSCDTMRQWRRGFNMRRYSIRSMGSAAALRGDTHYRIHPASLMRRSQSIAAIVSDVAMRYGQNTAHDLLQALSTRQFPTYDEALGEVMAGRCSVALSRRYWVGLSYRGDLVLGYYGSELTPLNPDNLKPIISKNIEHLADEINEITGGY